MHRYDYALFNFLDATANPFLTRQGRGGGRKNWAEKTSQLKLSLKFFSLSSFLTTFGMSPNDVKVETIPRIYASS